MIASSRKLDVREDPADDERVLGIEAAVQRLAERGELHAELPERKVRKRTSGSLVPSISAASIERPDLPRRSDATQSA